MTERTYEANKIPIVIDVAVGVTDWDGDGDDNPMFPAIEIFYTDAEKGLDGEEESMMFVLTSELALVSIIEMCEHTLRTYFATADEGESE